MLFPDMSVYDNLKMGAYLPRVRKTFEQDVEEIYTILPRLKERTTQLARTLSGGERRMLAIGRGLLSGGRILMIDEPSLGLAPIVIDQIYEIISDLKASGAHDAPGGGECEPDHRHRRPHPSARHGRIVWAATARSCIRTSRSLRPTSAADGIGGAQ